MSKTTRKNKDGKTHKEGRDMVFVCRCEYCLGKQDTVDRLHKERLTSGELLKCLYCDEDLGKINVSHHLNGWCVL